MNQTIDQTIDQKGLYALAQEAMKNAYAPYSKFQVGAALLTESGEIYTGVNVENASFGGTICAERTACVKAVSEGHRKFQAIAIVSSAGRATPCGICRQFLSEFGTDLLVITGDDAEHLSAKTLQELLPDDFRLEE